MSFGAKKNKKRERNGEGREGEGKGEKEGKEWTLGSGEAGENSGFVAAKISG